MWFARKNEILRWALSTATPALKRCPSTVTLGCPIQSLTFAWPCGRAGAACKDTSSFGNSCNEYR
jgi:hypothetical protein